MLMLVMLVTCFAACSGGKPEDTTDGADITTTEKAEDVPAVEDIFKKFKAETLDGEELTQKIFKGKKVTMINVWGTFCGPCIKEMPELQKLSENYADKGFQIVGIVCDAQYASGETIAEKVDEAKGIIKDTGVKYVNILPYEALNQTILSGSYSIPLTYFVDEEGNILGESYLGSKSYEDWEQIVLALF